MRPQIVTIYAFALLFFSSCHAVLAQSSEGKKPPPPDAPGRHRTFPELYIDDQIYWLVLAALIYGAYVAYKRGRLKDILG